MLFVVILKVYRTLAIMQSCNVHKTKTPAGVFVSENVYNVEQQVGSQTNLHHYYSSRTGFVVSIRSKMSAIDLTIATAPTMSASVKNSTSKPTMACATASKNVRDVKMLFALCIYYFLANRSVTPFTK